MKTLALAVVIGAVVGLGSFAALGPMRTGPSPSISLALECDELPDPKGYVEATAPATREFPAVVHVYWNPTGAPISPGDAPYWLIRANPVEGGVQIEVEWPTKPTIPWLGRLDWKGGPLEGKFNPQGWQVCPP